MWSKYILLCSLIYCTILLLLGWFFIAFRNWMWTFTAFVNYIYRYICNYIHSPVIGVWFSCGVIWTFCTNFGSIFLHLNKMHNFSENPVFSLFPPNFQALWAFACFAVDFPPYSTSPCTNHCTEQKASIVIYRLTQHSHKFYRALNNLRQAA